MKNEKLVGAHKHCSKHKDEIKASTVCACFACLKRFAPSDIRVWLESEGTALCPYCSVDAVIGDKSGLALTDEFLTAMQQHWF